MHTRREIITATAAALVLGRSALADEVGKEQEVTVTEDLMREHGIIRRALLVYGEMVPRLRSKPESVDASALRRTGLLFRQFGENYHERELEEPHIFPVIRKMKDVARYADVLTSQH